MDRWSRTRGNQKSRNQESRDQKNQNQGEAENLQFGWPKISRRAFNAEYAKGILKIEFFLKMKYAPDFYSGDATENPPRCFGKTALFTDGSDSANEEIMGAGPRRLARRERLRLAEGGEAADVLANSVGRTK
jgi:hypothetical protein